ncbi:MAG TPA: general secretion pathway protein GspB [Burkholderiaceae bacterium]|jgi:general secretion pathway protein B
MSYILDALKKAESERNLGAVPTVHASVAKGMAQSSERPLWRMALPWILVLLMGCALLLGVLFLHPWAKAPVEKVDPTANAQGNQQAEAERKPEQSAPSPAASITPAAQDVPVAPALAIQKAEKPIDKPVGKTVAPVENRQPETVRSNAAKPLASNAPQQQSPPETPVTEEESVGAIQDLPPNIQRELPQVSVNGYIYAKNPADRSVLINKRLMHEGETIAPDLVLEKMTPKGAVLNFKGYRYRIAY